MKGSVLWFSGSGDQAASGVMLQNNEENAVKEEAENGYMII